MKPSLTILFLFIYLCSQGQDIKYEEVKIGCLNLLRVNEKYVITSNDEYKSIFESKSPHPNCDSYDPPEIDFNKKMLLGYQISVAGCTEPNINFRVFKSDGNLVFHVDVIQNGICKALFTNMIWITVPKESGEKINFVSSHKLNK